MDESTLWHLIFCSLIALPAIAHSFSVYRSKSAISVVDLAYWITSAYFGCGPWVAFAYGKGELPFEEFDVLGWTYLSIGLFLVGLRVSKIFTSGKSLQRTNSGLFHLLQSTSAVSLPSLVSYYAAVWTIRLLLGNVYGIGISGTVTEESLATLPYYLFVISSLLEVVAFACILCASGLLFAESRKRRVALLMICVELIWLFGQGRRWVLGLVVVMGLAFLATGRRPKIAHLFSGCMLLGLLIFWAFPAFLSFRSQYLSSSTQGTVADLLEAGRAVATESGEESKYAFRENMAERPLIVGFNFRITEAQKNMDFMWGKAFGNTFLWTVPSFLYPAKFRLLPSEENIQHYYDLEVFDTSSNWPAYASADFGWLGALLVGCLFGCLLAGLQHLAIAQSKACPFLGFCILGVAVSGAITVEETPIFVWGSLRSLLLITVFLKLIAPLFDITGFLNRFRPAGAVNALQNF
jgi:hypothetical protein